MVPNKIIYFGKRKKNTHTHNIYEKRLKEVATKTYQPLKSVGFFQSEENVLRVIFFQFIIDVLLPFIMQITTITMVIPRLRFQGFTEAGGELHLLCQ